jgi:ketosteroid isomerase-like protein
MVARDLESARQLSHDAVVGIFKGDPRPAKALFSDRDDVTLGNPFGPYAHGRRQVDDTLDRAAANYRDGKITNIELVATYSSGDLACVVEVEHGMAKIGGGKELLPLALRVTSLFRHESGSWKLVHRHADPITTPRPASSVISS